jgi:hypothetical protein
MNDFLFAGMLASISRFIRHRQKRKHPERELVEVHLPEALKFAIYWLFMIVWVKFVNMLFALV